jgi:hypothetical protein
MMLSPETDNRDTAVTASGRTDGTAGAVCAAPKRRRQAAPSMRNDRTRHGSQTINEASAAISARRMNRQPHLAKETLLEACTLDPR